METSLEEFHTVYEVEIDEPGGDANNINIIVTITTLEPRTQRSETAPL